MKLISARIGFLVVVALGLTLTISNPVWPGGSGDEDSHDHDDGPRYFGFVKDASGKIVPDAKVTAEVKGLGSVIARSDKLGTYKLPGCGKQIDPKNVTISCSKDGYQHIRNSRRPQATTTTRSEIEP